MHVFANQACFNLTPVHKSDVNCLGVVHDVTVREYVAIGSEDKARTTALAFATLLGRRRGHFNVDDRRADDIASLRNGIRICIQQICASICLARTLIEVGIY